MPDPINDVKPAAPVVAASPAPAQTVQPAPVAKPGESSRPVDVKPQESLVPLPALQEERTKRQALEAEVADLRRMVGSIPQAPVQQQPAYNPRAEIDKLWEEDPKKAVLAEIDWKMGYRDWVDANVEIHADQMALKYPDFNNYRSIVMGHVRSLPVEQRANEKVLEAAYFYSKGQRFDTLIQQREAEIIERYRRGELSAQGLATPPGSFSSPMLTPGVQLTEEQRRVAEAMGMSPEGYASQIKRTA